MKKLFVIILSLFAVSVTLPAQKKVWLTGTEPYSESFRLDPLSQAPDAGLRLAFDEEANTLTVSLSSAEMDLFAFHSNVRYGSIFRKSGRLRPEKLPYKVSFDPSNVFRMRHSERKSLPGETKKYVFRNWVEAEGMEPVGSRFSLPEDSLVQVFRLNPSCSGVSVRLGDIMALERKGAGARSWNKYRIVRLDSLKLSYEITVVRDLCRGKDAEIAKMNGNHEQLSAAISELAESFPGGIAETIESFEAFHERRNKLLKAFPRSSDKSDCTRLQEATDRYNSCVDSLIGMKCSIAESARGSVVSSLDSNEMRIDVPGVLSRTRQIDELTSKWILSTSKSQKLDIMQRCNRLIREATDMIIGHRVLTEDDARAVELFRQARDYHNRVCK